MKYSEEQQLLKQAIGGDRQAFSALLEEYYRMIYNTAFKWTGNQEDSEDIAQEVCIKLGRSIRDFRIDSKFSTWLYRIVLNTVNDFHRKKKNHRDIEDIHDLADPHSAESHAQRQELWHWVIQLPEKQRDAVLLVYGEGLAHGETANAMECKESTVSWYIHEAKKQLKIWMHRDGR